ncbi:MAG TPA: hypothetical protein VIV57_26380 [Anaeromyxobacter sp.]
MKTSPAALLLAAFLAANPLAACGRETRMPTPSAPDAAAAEARYRAFHDAAIAPRLGEPDRRRAAGLLERKPAAESSSCRAARKEIASSGQTRNLHGSLDALDRDGDCWVLRWDGLLGLGLGAVVARDGTVLLSWWIPEG